MTPVRKITVTDIEVSVSVRPDSNDYICLTDMAHYKDKERTNYIIQNWMRLRSTIDFLGLWERINNPAFKSIEFDAFKMEAGTNSLSHKGIPTDERNRIASAIRRMERETHLE